MKFKKKISLRSQKIVHGVLHVLWRYTTKWDGVTTPIFIFGSQRSGTTMLGQCLGWSPELLNLGEFDERLFDDFMLRDNKSVVDFVGRSRYQFVVLKPLKDSHRVDELLGLFPNSRAVWMFRDYLDRVNSAVIKFGRHPLNVFKRYKETGQVAWQLYGISEEDAAIVRSIDYDKINEYDAAALMWYVRNSLYFNQQLRNDGRVVLMSYNDFVSNPGKQMQGLTDFVGARFADGLVKNVHAKSIKKHEHRKIDDRIAALCDGMLRRLEENKTLP